MAANSLPRRLLKRALAPVLNEATYSMLQAAAMSWDISRRSWYEPELDLLPHAVRAGETVFDIGANFGLYAYHLGPLVGETGRVYCFEPVPFTARTFHMVARMLRFRNVELIEKGCSDRAGTAQFSVPVTETGAIAAGLAHLHDREDTKAGEPARTRQIAAEVVALDELLPDVANLSLIKCDVEGADLLALRGARRLIERHHPTVICEINPEFIEGFGLSVNDLVSFFADRGYRMHSFEAGQLVPSTAEPVGPANGVFVHPERRERVRELIAGPG